MFPVEEFYLGAFYELITGRNSDGRISWKDIDEYALRANLDDEVRGPFKQVMRALEKTFCTWLEEEKDRKMRQSRSSDPTPPKQRVPKK